MAAIADAVATLLAKRAAAPYRLSYRAPAGGALTRAVTVPDGGIRGLTLSVQIGDDTPIKRTLAGLTASQASMGTALTAEASASIRQTLLGVTLLSFEGGAPSTATWIDDYVTGRLSTRALHEALAAKDGERIQAARDEGFTLLPEGIEALHVPPDAGAATDPVVMERGLRAVIYKFFHHADGTRSYRSDILQSTKLESTASTGPAAYKQTLEAGCRLALAEAKVFARSTVSMLKGVPLTRVAAFGGDVSFLPAPVRARWTARLAQYSTFDRLIPTSGAPFAMWAIDPATGTAFGVGEHGVGEPDVPPGVTDAKRIDTVLNAAGLLGGGPYYIIGKAELGGAPDPLSPC